MANGRHMSGELSGHRLIIGHDLNLDLHETRACTILNIDHEGGINRVVDRCLPTGQGRMTEQQQQGYRCQGKQYAHGGIDYQVGGRPRIIEPWDGIFKPYADIFANGSALGEIQARLTGYSSSTFRLRARGWA